MPPTLQQKGGSGAGFECVQVVEGHTAIGDMMTVVCLDDYHTNDRAGRKAKCSVRREVPIRTAHAADSARIVKQCTTCLLYTSDAADDTPC
eukprot:5295465-Amphidinium_carterae.1